MDEGVHDQQPKRDDHDIGLQHHLVANGDTLHQELAEAGQVEEISIVAVEPITQPASERAADRRA